MPDDDSADFTEPAYTDEFPQDDDSDSQDDELPQDDDSQEDYTPQDDDSEAPF